MIGVEIVAHGGTVIILDVENGDEEYAGRLEAILCASDSDELMQACLERLRYYA